MRWTLCGCGTADMSRLPRAWWMRAFFPSRRRYQCATCGHSMFVPLHSVVARAEPSQRVKQQRRQLARMFMGWTVAASALAAVGWGVWRDMDGPGLPFVGAGQTAVSAAAQLSPGRTPACHRTHIYKAGETLEGIAASEMGADWHAQDIWVLNRALLDRLMLEDKGLEPGQAIEVPAPCAG